MRAFSIGMLCLLTFAELSSAFAQTPPRRTCLPVSERAGREVGCWIMAIEPLGELPRSAAFWHLDAYPTRAEAEAAKGPGGTVVESLGKVWLFTIGDAGWRPAGGTRIAEIGPMHVKAGEKYSALYIEGISDVGNVTPKHKHPDPRHGTRWPVKCASKRQKAKLSRRQARARSSRLTCRLHS